LAVLIALAAGVALLTLSRKSWREMIPDISR
jgi:hypothetical protein